MIELPEVLPTMAKGTEVVTPAVLDTDGRIAAPAVLMEPGDVIDAGYDLQKLRPGQNDVDGAYWDAVCINSAVKIWLACGYLVNRGEGKAEALVSDLSKLDVGSAKVAIAECSNIGLLTQWAEGTESRALKKLISDRKTDLISKASGRPVRGANVPDMDLGVFGDNVAPAAADGSGEPAFGVGEQE